MREFLRSHNGRGIIRALPQQAGQSSDEGKEMPTKLLLEGDPMTHRREIERQIREREKKAPNEGVALTSSKPRGAPASKDDANPNHLADFKRLVDVAARKKPKD